MKIVLLGANGQLERDDNNATRLGLKKSGRNSSSSTASSTRSGSGRSTRWWCKARGGSGWPALCGRPFAMNPSPDQLSRPAAQRLLIVDGHAYAYRAFYALPADMATSSGQVTNAVYGFTAMLAKVVSDLGVASRSAVDDLERDADLVANAFQKFEAVAGGAAGFGRDQARTRDTAVAHLGAAHSQGIDSAEDGGVGDWTVSIVGRNLKTWSSYHGYDPEVGASGGNNDSAILNSSDSYGFPNLRALSLTITSSF